MAAMRRIGADVQAPYFLAAVHAAPSTVAFVEPATASVAGPTPAAPPTLANNMTPSSTLTAADLMNPALLYCGPVSAVQTPNCEGFPEHVKHLVTVTEAATVNLVKM